MTSEDVISFAEVRQGRLGTKPDDVLVAIPTLNEARHIERCLTSLMDADDYCARVTFAVADGGSDDGTRGIVQAMARSRANIVLVDNPDRLQAAGINRVVSDFPLPESGILVRCDAHADYPAGFVRNVVAALDANPDAASVVGVLDAVGTGCFQRANAWVVDTKLGSGGSAHRGGAESGWVDHGHHAGFRIGWFRRLGGYDPTFSHNEDAEYDVRLVRAGGKVWLDSRLRKDYVVRESPLALWRQYWRYGKGRARTVLKHRLRPRLRQLIPVLSVAVQGACLLVALVWPPALVVPLLYLALLAGVSLVGVVRLQSLCGLWAGVALFAMHTAWGAGFLVGILRGAVGR